MAPPEVSAAMRAPRRARSLDHGVEVRARELREGCGAPHEREELVFLPVAGGAGGDDLLREDVEGRLRRDHAVEITALDRREQRRALDELVPARGVEPALGEATALVAGAPHPLEEGRDRARRADLAHELDGPHVDAELERRRRDQHAQLASAQPLLHAEPALLRKAPVMRRDLSLAEALLEQVGQALGEPARIHEHERRAVREHLRRDPVEDLAPLLARGNRLELALGHLDRDVERAAMADVDDLAARPAARLPAPLPGADEQVRHRLDRTLRRGQTDPHRSRLAECIEALERECQMRAALVAGERVDLVDDERGDAPQDPTAALGREQQVEGFGRRDEQVRRTLQHRRALGGGGVAAAHEDPDGRSGETQLEGDVRDLAQRALEVLPDVDAERLERRDVDELRLVGEGALRLEAAIQAIDAHEEGGQRLSRAGRRGDQRVASLRDGGPALRLRLGRAVGKAALEPAAHGGMERRSGIHGREASLARTPGENQTKPARPPRLPSPHRCAAHRRERRVGWS